MSLTVFRVRVFRSPLKTLYIEDLQGFLLRLTKPKSNQAWCIRNAA